MLIVCAGPDSFQALRKAQDLERAFREKYDPQGLSVDHPASPSLEGIASSQGGGLFTAKRFIRCTGLIAGWKKTDWEKAAQVFARSIDDTIVVTVEESITNQEAAVVKGWQKSVLYMFPTLVGAGFFRYAEELARQFGVAWTPKLQEFAQVVEGDVWAFWNALPRWKATETLPQAGSEEFSPFVYAERYLKEMYSAQVFRAIDEPMQGLFLQQARQIVRLLGGVPDPRMPAFAQRKWQRLSAKEQERVLRRYGLLLSDLVFTRRGIAAEEEEALLLSVD